MRLIPMAYFKGKSWISKPFSHSCRVHHSSIKTFLKFLFGCGVAFLLWTLVKPENVSGKTKTVNGNEASLAQNSNKFSPNFMKSWSVPHMMLFLESSRMANRSACKLLHEFGGVITKSKTYGVYKDGQKSVCFDDGLKPTADDCLVYSFGIDNEWSFDDDMAKLGCDVYSFDPSMEETDYNRSEKIHFYQMGIWNKDGDIMLDKRQPDVKWKVLTLSSIYQRFKHDIGSRVIDYVKIDIEGDEWTVLPQIISSGMLDRVKQLAMEIHFDHNFDGEMDADDVRKWIHLLLSLERDHGMIPFDYKVNLACQSTEPNVPQYYKCAEIVYFNSKFSV